MKNSSFFDTLKSGILLRLAKDGIRKKILIINKEQKRVFERNGHYYFPEIDFLLPKNYSDFIFDRFNIFIRLPILLQGNYRISGDALLLEFEGYTLRITTSEELFIVQEIFVEGCYNFIMTGTDEIHVLDIGMNVGFASLYFSNKSFVKCVHGFEPFIDTYQQAIANFSLNKESSSKIVAHNIGLGASNEIIRVPYNTIIKGKNSTTKAADINMDETKNVSIHEARSILEGIVRTENPQSLVLKIDCEGAEYDIFRSLFSSELPACVKAIMMEWHGAQPQALIAPLIQSGFSLVRRGLTTEIGMIYAFR